jgi:hypothetical protein
MTPRHLNPPKPWRLTAMLSLGLVVVPLSWSQDDDDEEIYELSPFEVDASNDAGYYSERTLAGSRIDMKLSDLAASISVVNREQLEDTASTNINDVFLYDLNTEGAGTYTPTITSFRDGIRDGGSGFGAANTGALSSYATSNRVRGLAAPDASRNYYRSIPVMGFDSYNTRSIEINRGPNSLLFGQGSPAGIVNQNVAEAYTDVMQTEVQFRLAQYGGYRAHINHNQPIIDDVLGIYVAGLYNKEGFRRKPSHDTQRRVFGAVTYRPIKGLRIRGSYENFDQSQSRPNTLTPIDAVTPWLNAGRPAYNPVTRLVTIQDTGVVVGPYFQNAASSFATPGVPAGNNGLNRTSSPFYVPGINFIGGQNVTMIESRDNYFTVDTVAQGTNKPTWVGYVDLPPPVAERTPEDWAIFDRNWTRSATELTLRSNQGPDGFRVSNWQPMTVTDRSIYDWTKYNTNSPNYADFEGDTSNFEIDYRILDNWFVQFGYFDQNLETEEHFTLGQLNANRLWVDTNTHLLNGEVNPFFGQPYVEDSQPDTFLKNFDNSTMRLQTAVSFDFTGRDDIFRWLGRQNFVAIASRADWDVSQIRSRATTIAGHPAYLPERDLSTSTYWQRGQRLIRHYYMGTSGEQGAVTRSAPSFGQPSYGGPSENTNLRYNWTNGAWERVNTTWANAKSEATSNFTKERTDSIVLSWNAAFFDERLVPVVGFRHDNITSKSSTNTAGLAAADWIVDGYPNFDVLWANFNEQVTHGNTWTTGATFDLIRMGDHELTVFYNKSENFNPQAGVNVDFRGNRLQDPGGEGTDYGFSLGLFNNKFTMRVTWFEALSTGDTNGPANGSVSRLGDFDRNLFFPWAEVVARIELGQLEAFKDSTRDPYEELDIEATPAIRQRMQELTGIPWDYYANLPGTVRATQTTEAEGIEINMTWNPNPNWTFRAAISSQETAFSNVGPEVDDWLEERLSVWQSASSGLTAEQNVFLFNETRPTDLTNFWTGYGYNGNAFPDHPNGWNQSSDWYELNLAGNVAFYKAQEGKPVDNQRKWRANFIGRYTFTEGVLKGSFVGGGLRWEDEIAIGYFGIVGNPINSPDLLDTADLSRPIYDGANTYVDLWAGYRTKVLNDRADLLIQLNIRNVMEDGDLVPVSADFSGRKHTWRIVEPREVFLTTTLKF